MLIQTCKKSEIYSYFIDKEDKNTHSLIYSKQNILSGSCHLRIMRTPINFTVLSTMYLLNDFMLHSKSSKIPVVQLFTAALASLM